jgi:hypothetical protein
MMKRTIRCWLAAIIFTASFGGATLALAAPQPVSAACADRLLTFPAWYRGVVDDSCNVKSPNEVGGLPTFIWKIVLNIIEIMLQIVGFLSVGYIITGGFKYLTSTGSSDDIVKARKTIMNALIGLVISIFSVAIVNVVAGAV